MNILDENIDVYQCQQLRFWKVHFRQIGVDIGRAGMKDDDDILPLLHGLRRPTLLTLDRDFYKPQWRHSGYCLVWLNVYDDEAAFYIRQFLRHRDFRTQAKRMGKVIEVRSGGLSYWQIDSDREQNLLW